MAQPTQKVIGQLQYRTENARDFISDMHDKYSHYKKDKAINTMLKKLEYTMKLSKRNIKEIEDMNDDIQARLSDLFRRHIKEIESTTPDSENLKSHPY